MKCTQREFYGKNVQHLSMHIHGCYLPGIPDKHCDRFQFCKCQVHRGLWILCWSVVTSVKEKKKPGGVKSSQSPLLLIPHHGHTDTCTQDFPNDSAE